MTALDSSGLTEALADERLLDPEQYDDFVNAMLPLCQDVGILVREMVYRGWLTPYQVEQILAGRSDALVLGSYVLLEPLGEGAMGRVFRARNWKLNRIVAVKVIREEQSRQAAIVARFKREIRALGRIRHPNIVLAVDAELDGELRVGASYYAMEYFEGCDLGRYIRQNGPLSIFDACDFIAQTADALQHAYELGLIHRDIKPSNLLLTEPDHTIKLLDLGLTRQESPANDSVFVQMTHAGALIGTPDYMSPEQVKDSRSADVRSDLYSLGCTFYYLLAGAAPFEHVDAIVDKLVCQCESEPFPLEQLRPDVPPEIAEIVRKLMSKRRQDRFQTPSELVAALQALFVGSQHPIRDTILDAPVVTLVDGPSWDAAMAQVARTELITHSDLGLVVMPEEEEWEPEEETRIRPSRNALQIVVAVSLATMVLLLLWRWEIGPAHFKPNIQRPGVEQQSDSNDVHPADQSADAKKEEREAKFPQLGVETKPKRTRVAIGSPNAVSPASHED